MLFQNSSKATAMGDHGARAIIPLNIAMMIGCLLLSLVTLPWWMTSALLILMITIRNVARDQYGGMQLCFFLLPGVFLAMGGAAKLVSEASETGASPEFGKVVLMTVLPFFGFAVSMVAMMAVVVGAILGWEWASTRVKKWFQTRH